MAFRDSKISLTTILTPEDVNRAIAEFVMRRHQCQSTWQADLDWSFDIRLRSGLTQEEAEKTVKNVKITEVKVTMSKKE